MMFLTATSPTVGGGEGMIPAVTSSLGSVISWIGQVLKSLVGEGALASLWPLLAVGIAVSLVMLVVKVIKNFAWGA